MLAAVDDKREIILEDAHQSESTLFEDLVILDPLLLLQDQLLQEVLLALLQSLNLEEEVSDDLDALHIGLTQLRVILLVLLLCRVRILVLVDRVLRRLHCGGLHAVRCVARLYFLLFLVQAPIGPH